MTRILAATEVGDISSISAPGNLNSFHKAVRRFGLLSLAVYNIYSKGLASRSGIELYETEQ